MIDVVSHEGSEVPDIAGLVEDAHTEGISFVQRTIDEWRSGANRFALPGESFLLARDGDLVVGMCGVNVDPFLDDPSVGRLRHLYVSPSYRRRGVGSELVRVAVDAARGHFTTLRLRTYDEIADAFYVAVGFARHDQETATHAMDLSLQVRHRPFPGRPGTLYSVAPDAVRLAAMAADVVESEVSLSDELLLGLAGGSTPAAMYQELASRDIDWGDVTGWIPDERWVPPDHPDSNQRMARTSFADEVGLAVIGPDTTTVTPATAAIDYGDIIIPRLTDRAVRSFTLLGVGTDGHTASLFPGTHALDAEGISYVPNFVPSLDVWRLTASFGMLAVSDVVVFLVAGRQKADVVGAISRGEDLPAGRVTAKERVVWLLDADAASELDLPG